MERYSTNARFWIFIHGGLVKITLRPGQTLTHSYGGPCEEGWSRYSEQWHYDDERGIIERHWIFEAKDCDGRHANYDSDDCPLHALHHGGEPYAVGDAANVRYPDWRGIGDGGQYDQFAEMSGY